MPWPPGRRPIPITVSVYTTGKALTPLTREQIFSPEFLRFVAASRRDSATSSARWIERQVRAVQLLSSREKLMAGLPAEATDMVQAQTAALEADPKTQPKKIMAAYYDCGLVSEVSGDPEKAHEWYKKAVTRQPEKATPNQMMAMARIRKSIDDTKKLQNQQSN